MRHPASHLHVRTHRPELVPPAIHAAFPIPATQSSPIVLPNPRLLLAGRERLSRRRITLILEICGGFGTPRGRSAIR